jgi:hypothetical protein
VDPSRVVLLATICAVIMCCAGAVQLLGINRIVVTDGRIAASTTAPTASSSFGTPGLGPAASSSFGTPG